MRLFLSAPLCHGPFWPTVPVLGNAQGQVAVFRVVARLSKDVCNTHIKEPPTTIGVAHSLFFVYGQFLKQLPDVSAVAKFSETPVPHGTGGVGSETPAPQL